MKKLLLLGAVLLVASTSFADVITVLNKDTSEEEPPSTPTYSGVGYLPITSKGEILDVTDKVYLKIKPTSNIGPDGSSLFFDFGKLVEGNTSTLVGQFTAQVIKNVKEKASGRKEGDITETPLEISNTTLKVGFDKGDGQGASFATPDTSVSSTIYLSADGGSGSNGVVGKAIEIGAIDYTLTGSFEGKTKYIGNVQADARIVRGSDSNTGTYGAKGSFIDKTKRVAVMVQNLETGKSK